MIIPFSFIKSGISPDTNSEGKQAFLVIGDSTSAGVNNMTGSGPAPAANTAYYYRRATNDIVPITLDIVDAPSGTQFPTFCTEYYNGTLATGSAKKAVIIPTGVGGSNFSPEGDGNDWSTTGNNYALAVTDANNALGILGVTKLKAIFITSLGVNDARGSVALATIQADITSLITRLQTDFPGVPILIEQIGRDETATMTARIGAVRGYLRSICESNAGCHMINGMLAMYGAGGTAPDDIHPSQTGNIYRGQMYARWMLNNSYSKWARSIIASHFDELSIARKNAIATLIDNNMSDYLQHDSLVLFKTSDPKNIYTDWGFMTGVVNQGHTFTANDSITFNGTTDFLRTSNIKTRNVIRALQNDAFDALKIKTNITGANASTRAAIGGTDGTSTIQLLQTASNVTYRYNDLVAGTYASEAFFANNTEYLIGRNGTLKFLYKNGAQVHSVTQASTGNATQQTNLGSNNSSGTTANYIAISIEYYRTGRFTTINQATFKAALDTFLAAW